MIPPWRWDWLLLGVILIGGGLSVFVVGEYEVLMSRRASQQRLELKHEELLRIRDDPGRARIVAELERWVPSPPEVAGDWEVRWLRLQAIWSDTYAARYGSPAPVGGWGQPAEKSLAIREAWLAQAQIYYPIVWRHAGAEPEIACTVDASGRWPVLHWQARFVGDTRVLRELWNALQAAPVPVLIEGLTVVPRLPPSDALQADQPFLTLNWLSLAPELEPSTDALLKPSGLPDPIVFAPPPVWRTEGPFRLFDGPAVRWGPTGLELPERSATADTPPMVRVEAVASKEYPLRWEASVTRPGGGLAVMLFDARSQRVRVVPVVGAVPEWQVELRGVEGSVLALLDQRDGQVYRLRQGLPTPGAVQQVVLRTRDLSLRLAPGEAVEVAGWQLRLEAVDSTRATVSWTRPGESLTQDLPLPTAP